VRRFGCGPERLRGMLPAGHSHEREFPSRRVIGSSWTFLTPSLSTQRRSRQLGCSGALCGVRRVYRMAPRPRGLAHASPSVPFRGMDCLCTLGYRNCQVGNSTVCSRRLSALVVEHVPTTLGAFCSQPSCRPHSGTAPQRLQILVLRTCSVSPGMGHGIAALRPEPAVVPAHCRAARETPRTVLSHCVITHVSKGRCEARCEQQQGTMAALPQGYGAAISSPFGPRSVRQSGSGFQLRLLQQLLGPRAHPLWRTSPCPR